MPGLPTSMVVFRRSYSCTRWKMGSETIAGTGTVMISRPLGSYSFLPAKTGFFRMRQMVVSYPAIRLLRLPAPSVTRAPGV